MTSNIIRICQRLTKEAGIVWTVLAITAVSWTSRGVAEDRAKISQIEKECIAYRQSIKNGSVRVVTDTKVGANANLSVTFNIHFDEVHLFFHREETTGPNDKTEAQTTFEEKVIRTPKTVIHQVAGHGSRTLEGDDSPVTIFTEMEKVPTQLRTFDPRILGMTASLLTMHAHGFDSVVGRTDRASTTERDVEVEGMRCKVVEYLREDRVRASMWFANGDPRQLVRVEVASKYQGQGVVDRVNCRLELFAEGGVYFPRSLVCQKLLEEKVVRETRAQVAAARFNYELGEAPFSLSSLRLPPGTRVNEVPAKGPAMRWNGTALEPIGEQQVN